MYLAYQKREKNGSHRTFQYAKCYCGKVHKVRKDRVCPSCERYLDPNDAFTSATTSRSRVSYMPVKHDIYVDDDVIKIKYRMESVNITDKPYPLTGENIFYSCLRLDLKKRTSTIFITPYRMTRPEYIPIPKKCFMNVTTPFNSYSTHLFPNIEKVNEEIAELIGYKDYTGPLSVNDIIWYNRTRENIDALRPYIKLFSSNMPYNPYDVYHKVSRTWGDISLSSFSEMKKSYKRAKEEFEKEEIESKLSSTGIRARLEEAEDAIAANSKYLSERRKFISLITEEHPDGNKLLDLIASHNDIDISMLDKKKRRLYIRRPDLLTLAPIMESIFTNFGFYRDVLNRFSSVPRMRHMNMNRERIKEAFGIEKDNVFEAFLSRKIKDSQDLSHLPDTVLMIQRYRAYGAVLPEWTGTISDIHENIRVTLRKLESRASSFSFPSTADMEDYIYEEYTLKYAKRSDELSEVGDRMHICVGSYASSCLNDTRIFYIIDEKDNPIACCELRGNRLVQAKGKRNGNLSEELKALIRNHCKEMHYRIDTYEVEEIQMMDMACGA